jgi:hypothetical protein
MDAGVDAAIGFSIVEAAFAMPPPSFLFHAMIERGEDGGGREPTVCARRSEPTPKVEHNRHAEYNCKHANSIIVYYFAYCGNDLNCGKESADALSHQLSRRVRLDEMHSQHMNISV